jgi:hypothetical protein
VVVVVLCGAHVRVTCAAPARPQHTPNNAPPPPPNKQPQKKIVEGAFLTFGSLGFLIRLLDQPYDGPRVFQACALCAVLHAACARDCGRLLSRALFCALPRLCHALLHSLLTPPTPPAPQKNTPPTTQTHPPPTPKKTTSKKHKKALIPATLALSLVEAVALAAVLRPFNRRLRQCMGRMYGFTLDVFTHVSTVVALGLQGLLSADYRRFAQDNFACFTTYNNIVELVAFVWRALVFCCGEMQEGGGSCCCVVCLRCVLLLLMRARAVQNAQRHHTHPL